MRKGFLIYEEMCKYLVIYEEAVSHIWLCNCSIPNFLIYEENYIFFFISAGNTGECVSNAVESVHGCYNRSALTLSAGTIRNFRLPPSVGSTLCLKPGQVKDSPRWNSIIVCFSRSPYMPATCFAQCAYTQSNKNKSNIRVNITIPCNHCLC